MRKSIAIIGEGITEKYYIESLKGLSPFNILPRQLGKRASSLPELEDSIKKSIKTGYDEVYCLIDMDGKTNGKTKTDYERIKTKYHGKVHGKKKEGIECKVIFIETERCTELWFLYHFTRSVITREFASYREIEKELQKYRPDYCKHEKYFRSIANIHQDLTDRKLPKGSLKKAVENAEQSVVSRERENRTYTYSEMHILIRALEIPWE